MQTIPTRTQHPARYRRARSDSSLATLQRSIEGNYGLPAGSVRLVRPDGRKVRCDATVRHLRRQWEE